MEGYWGGLLESLQTPLGTQRVAEVAAEIVRQVGTSLKTHTEWPATGDLYRAEEDFRC